MIEGKLQMDESFLKNVFELGYSNAAAALAKFIPDRIQAANSRFGFYKLDANEFFDIASFSPASPMLLITTEVFGDISGKSYLFFSEQDIHALTRGLVGNPKHIEQLKEEFLKELDNILSASVITKLSNELNMKVYGDIPILVGRTRVNINFIILDDFSKPTNEVYVTSTFFTFENHPDVNPFFVWVMDGSIQQRSPKKSVVKAAL